MIENNFLTAAIVLQVVGFFSAIGSGYIVIGMVFRVDDAQERKRNLHRTFDRLLLCLCLADFVASVCFFLGPWLLPADPPPGADEAWGEDLEIYHYDALHPQAAGTQATCTISGLLVHVGMLASTVLTACIAISFVLQVTFRWSEPSMRIAERIFMAAAIVIPLSFSIVIFADKGFNANIGVCTIVSRPLVCDPAAKGSWDPGTDKRIAIDDYCENDVVVAGQHAELYRLLFTAIPVFVTLGIIIVCMLMLFWTVRTQELRTAQWSARTRNARAMQKRVFIKSILYIGSYLVSIVPMAVFYIFNFPELKPGVENILQNVSAPLQGVLNALIYADIETTCWHHAWQAGNTAARASVAASVGFFRNSVESVKNFRSSLGGRSSTRTSSRCYPSTRTGTTNSISQSRSSPLYKCSERLRTVKEEEDDEHQESQRRRSAPPAAVGAGTEPSSGDLEDDESPVVPSSSPPEMCDEAV